MTSTDEEQEERIAELAQITEELEQYHLYNKLTLYKPYPKQKDFHNSGSEFRERMLIAANQVGKTWCAGAEVSMHMTGQYPECWEGYRFNKPTKWWVAGVTGESTRDNPQRVLLGQKRNYGTGMVPLDSIEAVQLARGTPDLVDNFTVRHESGGLSYCWLKSYEKGREKWQGETLDGEWYDEEPPIDIYTEGLTRLNVSQGPILITFTPLLGMSEVVRRFLQPTEDGKKTRHYVQMTLHDADHYSEEQKEKIFAQYPAHEREARTAGVPMLGSGRVYPVNEDDISFKISEFKSGFPSYWPCIGAVDFGDWDHPTAGIFIRFDRDADTLYLYDCYRRSREKLAVHTKSIKAKGEWIPIAWPHDGHKHDRQSGKPIAELWRQDGVRMLKDHAQWEKGGFSVEAGVTELLDRMETGRLKVAEHLSDWWEEFRMYHRKDGKIVKEKDDLMDATRYCIMSLKYARLPGDSQRRPEVLMTVGDYDVLQ